MSGVRGPLGRRRLARRRARSMDGALERTLQERGVPVEEFASELWAAQVLDSTAGAQAPPPEALTVLRAALAAREARDARERRVSTRRLVPVLPGAVAAVVVGLVAYVGVGGGQRSQRGGADQLAVARSLNLVDQRMTLVESRIAAGQLSGADATVQELRDALLRVEQAAGGLDPGDPDQQALLASLYREIAMLNSLVARLHLRVDPLPTPVGYLGSVSAGPPTSASLPGSTTTVCPALNPARSHPEHGSSSSPGSASASASSGSGSSGSGSSGSGSSGAWSSGSGSSSSGSGSGSSGSGSSPAGLGAASSVAEPAPSSTTTTTARSSSTSTTSTTTSSADSRQAGSGSSTTSTSPLWTRPSAESTGSGSSTTTTGASSGSSAESARAGDCGSAQNRPPSSSQG